MLSTYLFRFGRSLKRKTPSLSVAAWPQSKNKRQENAHVVVVVVDGAFCSYNPRYHFVIFPSVLHTGPAPIPVLTVALISQYAFVTAGGFVVFVSVLYRSNGRARNLSVRYPRYSSSQMLRQISGLCFAARFAFC